MAATVASTQAIPPGLHPLQAAALRAAAAAAASSGQQQQAQQPQQRAVDQEPFDPATAGKLTVHDFVRVRTLGTGTFARVCLVRPSHGTEGDRSRVYALKILRKTEVIKLKQLDHVRHEREILASVRGHPFIINSLASFADADFLYFLLEYVPGGELFTYLRKFRRFDEDTARFYAAEIVLILEHLHEQLGGIAYRDMKPENLLLDAEGHIKLVDFGFAKRLGNNESGHPVETYTLCGTPEYLAPEVIHNKGHTTAVDWWACGILIYEFLTGYPPFWHQNPIEIYKQYDIILQFCTVDRSRRLGNISGGSARVKAHPFFAGVDWDAVYHKRRRGPIIPPVRYPGDAQCFDIYPEEDGIKEEYTEEMRGRYEDYFRDF
ncbi:kinase-like domain-containing protein [Staphylotrichum tortipilum]|uniref:Kinase-like domain-containing protein n=1 Tax=Staphylotrichum tortipilum TaxID=2831512 RepID=A0AAN6MJ62_9PEZI|nr:kinase-like domain-containing protein [Staphylotrichum longicolle]